jgi:hypothetical protein
MPGYIVTTVTVEVEITVRGPASLGAAVDAALGHLSAIPEHKVVSATARRTA